ncbi:MAG: hypothetical protein IIC91_14575 [Chloroflexi bacterium]|nr:hypothetical protein [Chloroflexota bacterium]
MQEKTIIWDGASGKKYRYWIGPIDSTFKEEPGNYVFVREVRPGVYEAIYAGEAGDLADRLDNPNSHHKIGCIRAEGATHLCTHTTEGAPQARRDEESDIIARWKPPCNDQAKGKARRSFSQITS